MPSRQADITRLHMHTTVFESSCEGFTSLRAGRFSRLFSTASPENSLSERLTTPTRKAASAYNVRMQGLECVNENSSYFGSGKPMSHVQHDVQRLRRERFSRPLSTASSKKHAYSSDSFNINNTSVTPHAHYTAAKASRHSERCDLAGR